MDALVSINLNWGLMFLIQTTTGIISNSFLFYLYNFSLSIAQMVRPTNLIINHMVILNILVLISKGIPQTVATFGLTYFLGDSECKFLLYIYRVVRGVSISTTSLLSGFQAIKLHPNTFEWLSLRIKSSKSIGTCCFLCWIIHLLLNFHVTLFSGGPKNSKNLSAKVIHRYCSSTKTNNFIFSLTGVIISISDIVCLVLMAWASGSMVLALHKHKNQVQHIHSHSLSQRSSSHEDRATCTILILVTMFLSFYSLASILSLWITQTVNPSHWLLNISVLMSLCYPTLSPIVFNFSNICVPHYFFVFCTKKTNCPTLVSKF